MSSKAWPARETESLGGWLLRADDGVTRRANSVLPLGSPGEVPLDEAIAHVLRFYTKRMLPVCFQMTAFSQPTDLDSRLDARGFVRELVVHIQTSDLRSITSETPKVPIILRDSATDSWMRVYAEAEGYDPKSAWVRRRIIDRIALKKAHASATAGGRTVAVGLGVLEGDWLGLFSIATLDEYRRQKAASSVIVALCAWGLNNGAKTVYLQVESRNSPALAMYEKMGFRTLYTYWYRMLKTGT